jgi:hypothetical protein
MNRISIILGKERMEYNFCENFENWFNNFAINILEMESILFVPALSSQIKLHDRPNVVGVQKALIEACNRLSSFNHSSGRLSYENAVHSPQMASVWDNIDSLSENLFYLMERKNRVDK